MTVSSGATLQQAQCAAAGLDRGDEPRDAVARQACAVGESSVILLHPPLPLAGVSTGMEEGVSAK